MLYIYAAQSETMFFALRCICFNCSTGKASQAANATSNGGDASRVHKDKGSQTALITLPSVSPCHNFPHKTGLLKNAPTRDASPLEVAFAA